VSTVPMHLGPAQAGAIGSDALAGVAPVFHFSWTGRQRRS
jgi:hypothetical protein